MINKYIKYIKTIGLCTFLGIGLYAFPANAFADSSSGFDLKMISETTEDISSYFKFENEEVVLYPGEKVTVKVNSDLLIGEAVDEYTWIEYENEGFPERDVYYLDVSYYALGSNENETGNLSVSKEGEVSVPLEYVEDYQDTIIAYVKYKNKDMSLEGLLYLNAYVKGDDIIGDDIVLKGNTVTYSGTTEYTYDSATFKVDDESIATVDENGNLTALKYGTVTLTRIISDGATVYEIFKEVRISDPVIDVSKDAVAVGGKYKIKIDGIYDDSSKTFAVSKKGYVSVDENGTVLGLKKRTNAITITAVVDGKKLTTKVIVTNPKFSYGVNKPILLVKGKKATVKVRGISKNYSDVSYDSSRKNIASVTKAGKVKGKKYGGCYIKVTVDYKTFKLNCAVGNKKAIKAVKRAYKAVGATYSQLYRMSASYYDCSSLVYRSFSPYGMKFGATTNWAPVAAEEYRYLVNTKKSIAKKKISTKKLRPGDVVFYSGWNNGRYRNITHVAIYVTNGVTIEASDYGVKVGEGTYKKQSKIVGIGRPFK